MTVTNNYSREKIESKRMRSSSSTITTTCWMLLPLLPLGVSSLVAVPQCHGRNNNNNNNSVLLRKKSAKLTVLCNTRENFSLPQPLQQIFTSDDDDDGKEIEEDEDSWLGWMSRGARSSNTKSKHYRGSAEVILREPAALGGLPRSDRYASRDWLHNTINLPRSAILRDVRHPVLSMTFWGVFISVLHRTLINKNLAHIARRLCIPTAPHSLTVSALGLLLVFRTNSAYQRFTEGRKIWEQILNTARELSRLTVLYENEIGIDKRRRVQRLLAAFPYLLRFRIRPNSIMKKMNDPQFTRDPEYSLYLYQDHAAMDTDPEAAAVAAEEETTGYGRRKPRDLYWVDKRTLPWRLLPGSAIEECARAQNRPLWVCDRMAKELHSVPDGPSFTARERLTLLSKVDSLSRAIGACERIHQTVVPLNYARHALRSLTMWLISLPFALVKDLGLLTGPVLFILSWMLFGVYEIGYSIEDPFQGTLRLSILCDAIRRDVIADEVIRNTAFKLTEPVKEELKKTVDDDDEDDDDNLDGANNVVEIEEIVIGEDGDYVVPEKLQNNVTDATAAANSAEAKVKVITSKNNDKLVDSGTKTKVMTP